MTEGDYKMGTAPGSLIGERYRVIKLLGQGGMGAVHEAIDQRLKCSVALKELTVDTQKAREAFEREATLLANLRHIALPVVTDRIIERDSHFLVMQFISGPTLDEQLSLRDGPFPVEVVLRWADELLDVLEYLHSHNPPVLHRDIKPRNLKLTEGDRVVLLDFGLSKGSVGQMSTLVESSSIFGYTPAYSPVEQVLNEGTEPASDLYALAATLYHLVTGAIPPTASRRLKSVADGRPDPLSAAHELRAEIPQAFSELLNKVLAIRIEDRRMTATEIRRELREIRRGRNYDGEAVTQILPPDHLPAKGVDEIGGEAGITSSAPDIVDEFLETLDFQNNRRRWKGSRVGVNAFEFEVKLIIHKLEEMADEVNKRSAKRGAETERFAFRGDALGCSIYSRDTGLQLIVAWENESLVDLAEAKLLVGLRDHRKPPTDTGQSEPKEIFKTEYRPDVKAGFRKGWQDPETARFLTSEALAEEYFDILVQRALNIVRGEIR